MARGLKYFFPLLQMEKSLPRKKQGCMAWISPWSNPIANRLLRIGVFISW
jgi:hypothetical protein